MVEGHGKSSVQVRSLDLGLSSEGIQNILVRMTVTVVEAYPYQSNLRICMFDEGCAAILGAVVREFKNIDIGWNSIVSEELGCFVFFDISGKQCSGYATVAVDLKKYDR